MDNPAAREIVETVRKMNELARRARSGEPSAEDYLRAISSDPVTKWFAELLREKNEELEKEKQRVDRLACVLRAWYAARDARRCSRWHRARGRVAACRPRAERR